MASTSRTNSVRWNGAEQIVEARISVRSASGCASAYSCASMPPHDCPNRSTVPSPSPVRTASTSSTKRSTVHSDGSSGWSESPQPSWS